MGFMQKKIKTKLCDLFLVASSKGLQGVYWEEQKILTKINTNEDIESNLSQAEQQIKEYIEGDRKNFSLKLDIVGTAFQLNVWHQLQNIPYGKTISYKTLAEKCYVANGYRAVGNANGKNPLCLVIPCHRVIASDGSLGGYSGGLKIKEFLLNLEKSN